MKDTLKISCQQVMSTSTCVSSKCVKGDVHVMHKTSKTLKMYISIVKKFISNSS